MSLTRAEIDAELRRRGVPIPGEQAAGPSNQLSRAEIDAELRRRGVPIPNKVPQESLNGFMGGLESIWNAYKKPRFDLGAVGSGITGFNKGVEDLTHGVMQPLTESGLLSERVKRGSESVGREREAQYRQAKQQNPKSAMVGNILGNIAVSAPLALAGGTPAIGRLPGFLKYLQPILGGAATGGLMGGASYINPGQSRIKNTLTGAAIGGALGGGAQALMGGKELAGAFLKTHPAEKFAGKFIGEMKGVQKQYANAYENFLTQAEKSGADKIGLPKINTKDIFEHAAKSEKGYLKKFITDPTIRNAHKAQSDLGKLVSRLKQRKGLSGSETDTLQAAIKAQNKIRNSIDKSLTGKGQGLLAKEYKDLTAGYTKDVIPYRTSNAISKFDRKNPLLTPEAFRKKLSNEESFKALVGAERHPELYKLPKLGKIGSGLGVLYGINKLHDLFKD
jgi:hypothetical protein